MANTVPVAKLRICVQRSDGRWCLMSRKRKSNPKKRDHDKLEMLGGHLDPGESPLDALIRECAEEEKTGRLAAWVAERGPPFATETVDGAEHHLFELVLSEAEASSLEAHRKESLGFRLVPADRLQAGELDDQLTYRTRLILKAFGPAPGAGA